MQVSQIAELDSHAVIGGGASQSFFMSDSAEFFTILSDTLYRDKELAVVREVVCNAHDAHVMGNCLDKPIEILLTEQELTIRDFGPGIAADRMHAIYCGYGVSTKVNDANQIGGFGLGSKSPFAYADHYTSTTCHAGLRTVYSISRGGLESDGKPALRQMVQVPTTETGVTVSVPIKNKEDVAKFGRIIEQVVKNGGINATLNGTKLKAHDFTGIEKSGFGLLVDHQLAESPVYARIGSVLYPVSTNNPELTKLTDLFKNEHSLKLIVWGKPGELGITPSREALSYSDSTIKALTERLTKINRQLMGRMPEAMRTLADQQAKRSVMPIAKTDFDKGHLPNISQTVDPAQAAIMLLSTAFRDRYGVHLNKFKTIAGRPEKALLKAAMRKHRDYRAVFRRAAGKGNGKRSLRDRFHPLHDWLGYSGSLLIRTCVRLGILEHVARHAPYHGNGRGLAVRPIKQCAHAWEKKPVIVFCRTRGQAEGHASGKSGEYAYIVTQRLKPHQIDEAEKLLIQKGFACERLNLDKPAPEPKRVTVKRSIETFYDISGTDAGHQWAKLHKNSPMLPAAPVFIECGTLRDDEFQASMRSTLRLRKLILKAYPKVSLAIGANQKKALIAAGSKDLMEVFQEEVKALKKDNPDTVFAFAAAGGDLFGRNHYRDATDLGSEMAGSDLRFAKLLAGQRVVVSDEQERAFHLARLCEGGLTLAKIYPHFRDLKADCYKLPVRKTDLSYLKSLCTFYGRLPETAEIEWSDDLCEVIRLLQRRHAKSNLQLVKEAA